MKEATEAEMNEAFELVKLIQVRGYGEGIDLLEKFEEFKKRFLSV